MTANQAPKQVVIIGAGLAGLCCARKLSLQGVNVTLLEASDGIGGRVRTDEVEGFRLDRGFQVFLTSYPEAKQTLNYAELDLRPFEPGALVRHGGKFHRFSDPWRRPLQLPATALSQVGTLADKLRIATLRKKLNQQAGQTAPSPAVTTLDYLRQFGFSETIINRFFRPFMGGVFLESDLATTSHMFEFVFGMFGLGDATLPAAGMEAIPQQLAAALPAESLKLNTPAQRIELGEKIHQVHTKEGGIEADVVVMATEGSAVKQLLPAGIDLPASPSLDEGQWRGVTCLYFAAPKPPLAEGILVLNGDRTPDAPGSTGPINNLCVPSHVSSRYAPAGQSLVSVTVLDEHRLSDEEATRQAVVDQLADWYGSATREWRHLKTYDIRQALPHQLLPTSAPNQAGNQPPKEATPGVWLTGDWQDTASINGAMRSGNRVAEAILKR